jgi:osmotically-inducible protein OsmY
MLMQRSLLALAISTVCLTAACASEPQAGTEMGTRRASTTGDQRRMDTPRTDTTRADRDRMDRDTMSTTERDRMEGDRMDPQQPTAMDQSESAEDLEITRQIRAAVVGDSSLSVAARNVTIVTRDAVVTLRGNVTSNAERDAIDRHAHQVSGVQRVENMLSVGERQ